MNKELEAKYFIKDKYLVRKKIEKAGLKLIKPEFLMKRKTFDSGVIGSWIRIRDEGDKITMTFKKNIGNTIDDVLESEIIVNDFEKASEIINQTNYKEKSYQENYREIWKNEEVEIVIDTWPFLDAYIEIESNTKENIEKYSQILDFDFNKAFFGSVSVLYEKKYGISKKDFLKIDKIIFNDYNLLKILEKYRINK